MVAYQCLPLFGDKPEERLIAGRPMLVEGDLDGYLVLSVPESTTVAGAQRLQQDLEAELGRKVLLVTHNLQFMRMVRLSPSEAAAVIRRIEVPDDGTTAAIEQQMGAAAEEPTT